MSDLDFRLRIGVDDATEQGLASAASRFKKFLGGLALKPLTLPFQIGRAGLGILRDLNLGLMPLVRGIDSVIERGSKLEIIQRGFRNITGQSSRNADIMAKQIVRAASGTLRMADAMALANRSLGTMNFDDLLTAVEFVSKKSVATGKDAGDSLNTVITGLVRGSTLFLDDFGILVDGVDGVKRTYDGIKGSGAFDSLGPAAQKAETIRQALAEMRGQIDKIGISGKSTFFLFAGIKNQIGDSIDRLVLAIAKSSALKAALQGTANLFRGVSDLFTNAKKGDTPFQDLFFGRKRKGPDGQDQRGGGLLSVLGAGILDLGELAGRGILGGILKGLSLLPDLFRGIWAGLTAAWDWAVAKIPPAIESGLEWLETGFLPALTKTIQPLIDAILDVHSQIVGAFSEWLQKYLVSDDGTPTMLGRWFGISDPMPGGPGSGQSTPVEPDVSDQVWDSFVRGMQRAFKFITFQSYADAPPEDQSTENLQSRATGAGVAGTLQGFFAQAALGSALATALEKANEVPDLWQLFGQAGDSLLSGGVLGGDSRVTKAFKEFNDQFAKPDRPQRVPAKFTGDDLAHTDDWLRKQKARLRRIEQDKRAVERGDGGVRQEANRRAAEEEADAKRKGFRVSPSDRRRIRQRRLEEVKKERLKELEEEEKRLRKEVEREEELRRERAKRFRQRRQPVLPGAQPAGLNGAGGNGPAPVVGGAAEVKSPALEKKIDELVAIGEALLAELAGGGKRLAGLGGRKA